MIEPLTPNAAPIRIGISACLLGQPVRYDGGHKHDRYLTETLGQYFEWVPVCPEVELGLGTPRETVHLVQIGGDLRLRATKTDADLTDGMRRYTDRRVAELAKENLSGYILKKDSPSCGMERVKVEHRSEAARSGDLRRAQGSGEARRAQTARSGDLRRARSREARSRGVGQADRVRAPTRRDGIGVFAAALLERLPNLPVEEEGRLCDPRLRENWVERVFAYHDLQLLWKIRWRIGDLVEFHTRYKFVLLSHDEAAYRLLGRLVADAKSYSRSELRLRYEAAFMQGLKRLATVRKNVNVLQHMLGFFSDQLDGPSRQELLLHIHDYHRGLVPLVVPLTLIRHYVRLLGAEYLQNQAYLSPHPKDAISNA